MNLDKQELDRLRGLCEKAKDATWLNTYGRHNLLAELITALPAALDEIDSLHGQLAEATGTEAGREIFWQKRCEESDKNMAEARNEIGRLKRDLSGKEAKRDE